MIVDLNTRIWESSTTLGASAAEQLRRRRRDPWHHRLSGLEDYQQAMQPVSHAVLVGFESRLLDACLSDETLAGWMAAAPGKFLGFAGIDPTAGRVSARIESARALGLKGVAISPAAAGFHPGSTRAMALFEACAALKLPVLVESGALMARESRMEFGDPVLLDEAARHFPDLKIILAGFSDPYCERAIALAAKHPTVYLELSGLYHRSLRLYGSLLECHQRHLIGQVLFGSGYPYCTPQDAILALYSVNTQTQGTPLPGIPREQLRSIVERDTLALLGLSDNGTPIPPTAPPSLPREKPPAAAAARPVTPEAPATEEDATGAQSVSPTAQAPTDDATSEAGDTAHTPSAEEKPA